MTTREQVLAAREKLRKLLAALEQAAAERAADDADDAPAADAAAGEQGG